MGGSGEPPLLTLDTITLVIVCRAINFDRVALCVGSIKGQRKISREGGTESVSGRAKPYKYSVADRPRSQRARVAGFRRRRTSPGKIRGGNCAPDRRGARRFCAAQDYYLHAGGSAGPENRHEHV